MDGGVGGVVSLEDDVPYVEKPKMVMPMAPCTPRRGTIQLTILNIKRF
jgi:hypothetical protein